MLLARGDALLRAGDPAAAREAFRSAAALARRRGDVALLGEAALGFSGLGIAIVDLDAEAIAELEEALEAAEDGVLRSRLQARLAVELYYAPDRTRSEALSAAAVATARAAGDPRALASALNARHVALWRPDRVEERLLDRRRHDRGGARDGRAPRRAAGAQLAGHRPLRARRHARLPRGDGPPRAAGGRAAPARVPVVHAAVGGRRRRCSAATSPRRSG